VVTDDHTKGDMDARLLVLTSMSFLTTAVMPLTVHRQDFRTQLKPLTIVAEKNSPAYAALEDSRFNYGLGEDVRASSELLVTGGAFKYGAESTAALVLKPIEISTKVEVSSKKDLLSELIHTHTAMTVSEYGDVLVREELAKRQHQPTERRLPTSAGSEIVVKKPVVILGNGLRPKPAPNFKPNAKPNTQSKSNTVAATTTPSQMGAPTEPPAREQERLVAANGQRLSGPLLFSGGAAWTGDGQNVSVYQASNLLRLQEGFVKYKEGRYEIDIEDPVGDIRVDVTNRAGMLLASGQINVAAGTNQAIEVKPVFNGVHGQVVSSLQIGEKPHFIERAKLYVAGLSREIIKDKVTHQFKDNSIKMPSMFIVAAVEERHWPTLMLGDSGKKINARLFSKSFIDAFLNLTLDKFAAREAQENAIIWGRITMQGRPLIGAEVSLVGETEKKTVYINGFLPDKTKVSTVSQAEFAIAKVEEEEKLLQVTIGGQKFWPVLVPITKKHVTYADLELNSPEKIKMLAYDAFSNVPLPTLVHPLGSEEQMFIPESGETTAEVQTLSGLTLLEAEASADYAPVRSTLKDKQTEVHFPLVRQDWLAKTNGGQRPITSVAAFVSGDDYDVLVGDGSAATNAKIVYFNEQGNEISAAANSRAGFAVFDLPRGLHTITIIPDRSKEVITQLVYVDEFATQTFMLNLIL